MCVHVCACVPRPHGASAPPSVDGALLPWCAPPLFSSAPPAGSSPELGAGSPQTGSRSASFPPSLPARAEGKDGRERGNGIG